MALIQLSTQLSCLLNHSVLNSNPLGLPKRDPVTQEQSVALLSSYVRPQTIRTVPTCDCIMNHTQEYEAVTGDFQEAT